MQLEDRELTERAVQIESLLHDIESLPDGALRAKAEEIVQDLLVLYGEGLARMLAIIREAAEPMVRDGILDAFTRDELISHLLLLHDLHPIPLEDRILGALEEVRPYLQSHGGNVALLGVDEGVARLRLQGSCSGCPSSTMTLKLAIEEAIQKAAPDVERIEAEGVTAPAPQPVAFLPASDLLKKRDARTSPQPSWTSAGPLSQFMDGRISTVDAPAASILVINLAGTLYAYRDLCTTCATSLEGATLEATQLICSGCGHRYDIQRAGRCLDAPNRHLEPIPLLIQDDTVKVALGSGL